MKSLFVLILFTILFSAEAQDTITVELKPDIGLSFQNCNPDICVVYSTKTNHFQVYTYIKSKGSVKVEFIINNKAYINTNLTVNMSRYGFYINDKYESSTLTIDNTTYKFIIKNQSTLSKR